MPSKTWTLDSGQEPAGLRSDLTRAQDRLGLAVGLLEDSPLTGCKVIGPITFSGAVAVDVYHRLPKRLTGWIIIDRTTSANVWNTTAGTNDRRDYITLTSSAATVITLLVF